MNTSVANCIGIGCFGRTTAIQLQERLQGRNVGQLEQSGSSLAFYCASSLPLQRFTNYADSLSEETSVVGIFLLERFLFVTPSLHRSTGPCAHCYRHRLLSHPPYPFTDFATRAVETVCNQQTDFEYTGWSASLVRLAVELAWTQALENNDHSIALDIGTLGVLSDTLVPLHGCRCRHSRISPQHRGVRRFVAFVPDLPPSIYPTSELEGQP